MATIDSVAAARPDKAVPSCPYRGLMPYTEVDAAFFYGREQDSRLIVDNLLAYPLSVMFGPSGVGKSSVLRAGVLRMIAEDAAQTEARFGTVETLAAYCSNWRDDPARTLARTLSAALRTAAQAPIVDPYGHLDSHAVIATCRTAGLELLLVLDQFEEFFLYHADEGDSFARELAALLAPGSPVSVLIAIREDALGKLDKFEAALPGIFDNTLRLEHLDRASAREAITKPLQRWNSLVEPRWRRQIEPELVEALLDQVATGRVRVGTSARQPDDTRNREGDAESIEAPFLQLVLTRLWEAENTARSWRLRQSTLLVLGGAQAIVRDHLDHVLAGFDEHDCDLLADIFEHLVTPSGTKIAHKASDLAALAKNNLADVNRLLWRLTSGDQRVLREVPPPPDNDDAESRFEVFHDVLALAVLDWRRRWVAAREQMRAQAGLLQAKEAAERDAHTARRRLRRSRIVGASLVILVAISLVSAYLARQQTQKAEQAELLEQHRSLAVTDPSAALQTALNAWQSGGSTEAEEAVRQSFDAADTELILNLGDQRATSAEFSSDGTRVLTTSEDGHVRLWSAASGKAVCNQDVRPWTRTDRLFGASLVGDDDIAVVAGASDNVVLVNLQCDESSRLPPIEPVTLDDPKVDGPVDIAIPSTGSRDRVLTFGYGGGPAVVWDVGSTGEPVGRYGADSAWITAAALGSAGQQVATSATINGKRGLLRLWDVVSGESYTAPSNVTFDFIRFIPGTTKLVAADRERAEVLVWNWRTGAVEPIDTFSTYRVNWIDVDNDARRIVVAGDKSSIVYDLRGQQLNRTNGSRDWTNAARVSPDGKLVAAATNDGEVQLFYADRVNAKPLWEYRGHDAPVLSVAFSSDSKRLVSASSDGTVRVWRVPERTVAGEETLGWALVARFTPDGESLVTGSASGVVQVIDGATGERQWRWPGLGRRDFLNSIDPSPDGEEVVRIGQFSTVPVVLTRTGEETTFENHPSGFYLTRARWSPTDPLIVAGNWDNQVIAWDADTGARDWVADLSQGQSGVVDLEFSADGRRLVTVSDDEQLRVLNSTSGDQLIDPIDVGRTTDVGVSHDGRFAVTAGEDQTVRIWDLGSGQVVHEFEEPVGTLAEVTFSKDEESSWVASVGAEGMTYVWDRETGTRLAVLRRHGDAVNAVSFDPRDRSRLATASDDGTTALYSCTPCDLTRDQLEDAAEARMPRGPAPGN